MTASELFEMVGIVTAALGGGTVVVGGFSTFLGKVWADRLMANAQGENAGRLAQLTDELRHKTDGALAEVKTALEIGKDKHLRHYDDRLVAYRQIIDLVATVLASFDKAIYLNEGDPQQSVLELNRERIRIFGYLGLVAPQPVMDRFTDMETFLLEVSESRRAYKWEAARALAIALLNEMRHDLDIGAGSISYNGVR